MKKANKLFVPMLFVVMLLFVVIAVPLVQNTLHAATSTLSSMPIGAKLMFGGQLFSVADPSTGLVISRKITHMQVFDPDNTNVFDTADTNNIGYYLNNTYYNTFTPAQKAQIKNATWYTGDELNESASNITAKIGLVRLSQYYALKGASSPAEASKIFSSNGDDSWILLLTPVSGSGSLIHYVDDVGVVKQDNANKVPDGSIWNDGGLGIRPALQILESTIFTYDTSSGIYYEGTSATSGGKINGLSVGATIMFGNEAYRLVNPAKGLMVPDYNFFSAQFDPDGGHVVYNPSDSNNLAFYLNNTFFNTFTADQKTLIKDSIWNTGDYNNESSSSVVAKIGLLTNSDYDAVHGDSNPAEAGKIFPNKQASFWWLLTPLDGSSTMVVCADYTNRCWTSSVDGVRPALQILETTDVLSVNGQAGVYMIETISAPTDIALSSSSIAENLASGTNVGTLSRTDPDTGDTEAYTLVAGAGDTDNASFSISGTDLKTAAIFNFDVKNSYSIRIRVTDGGGLWYEEVFTITVIDLLLSEATNIIITPIGGNVIANTLNTTNLNMIATATIVAGEITGGHAELLIDGVVKLTDNTITAIDTTVDFDTSDGSPSNTELQTAIASGGVVSVKLYDSLANSKISSVGNPILVVDYNKPWANDITININENSTTGWFNLDCGDVGGESLVMAFGGNNLLGTFGTNGITSVWFNPDPNWNGLAWFFFKINGSNGNTSEWKSVFIAVNPINYAPCASNKTETTDEDINTGWKTIDCGDLDGDVLTIELAAINNIPGVFETNNSTYRYYPEANWNGTAWFDFRVKDPGGLVSAWKHEIITVNPINDLPTLANKTINIAQDTVLTFENSIFSGFADIDGDSLSKIKITSLPLNGTLKLSGIPIIVDQIIDIGNISSMGFTPNTSWFGVSSFNCKVEDGVAYSNLDATISINVTEVVTNTPPTITEQKKKVFSYTFSTKFKSEQFKEKFVDNDGNTLKKVKITSLPSIEGIPSGNLKVGDRIINTNDEINFEELSELTFIKGNFTSDRYTPELYTVVFKWKGFDGAAYSNEATFILKIEKLTIDIG